MEELLKLFGVGVKVANCEILFGYHRLDAFPKDVWINRVLENHYPNGFLFEKYAPYNGIMQQYLFFYSRLSSM
jgi:N-glycosylase/DNA lyase